MVVILGDLGLDICLNPDRARPILITVFTDPCTPV